MILTTLLTRLILVWNGETGEERTQTGSHYDYYPTSSRLYQHQLLQTLISDSTPTHISRQTTKQRVRDNRNQVNKGNRNKMDELEQNNYNQTGREGAREEETHAGLVDKERGGCTIQDWQSAFIPSKWLHCTSERRTFKVHHEYAQGRAQLLQKPDLWRPHFQYPWDCEHSCGASRPWPSLFGHHCIERAWSYRFQDTDRW